MFVQYVVQFSNWTGQSGYLPICSSPLRTKTDQEIQRFVAMEEDCIKQEMGVATG